MIKVLALIYILALLIYAVTDPDVAVLPAVAMWTVWWGIISYFVGGGN